MEKSSLKLWFATLLIFQVLVAVIATASDNLYFKIGVAGIGIIVLIITYAEQLSKRLDIWVVILAFMASMAGDCFLSNMNGDNSMFIKGIALYLVAHIGYLIFSLLNGSIKWRITIGMLLAFLVFYYLSLNPHIPDKTLAFIVLFYLVVSCVSLGAALGIRSAPIVKWFFVIGIALILISDTIISFKEFVKYDSLNFLILPTYYLAQIGITIAIYLKSIGQKIEKV